MVNLEELDKNFIVSFKQNAPYAKLKLWAKDYWEPFFKNGISVSEAYQLAKDNNWKFYTETSNDRLSVCLECYNLNSSLGFETDDIMSLFVVAKQSKEKKPYVYNKDSDSVTKDAYKKLNAMFGIPFKPDFTEEGISDEEAKRLLLSFENRFKKFH